MPNPFADEAGPFDVLVNLEGQHSLWPSTLPAPAGWERTLRESDRATCLTHIRTAWPDIRPQSLVSALAEGVIASGESVPEMFAAQVALHRDDTAVVGEHGHLTYGELDQRSERLALALLARGLGPEARVAVLMDRSVDLVVALLAILRAGAVYVPLPLDVNPHRGKTLVAQVRPSMLLVDEQTALHPLLSTPEGTEVPVLRVDQPVDTVSGALPVIHPEQLAYITHTSGSTGTPKGVAITHRTVTAFATDQCWREINQGAVLFSSPPIFDGTTYGIWVPLLGGGRVVVAPPGNVSPSDMAEYIKRSGATSALLIPYRLNSVVDHALDFLGGLELLWTGGDVVAGTTIERLLNRFPDLRFANGWGLTETTVISTWHLITAPYQAESSVPVGRAMNQCQVYVLDDDLRPVPPGATGEAYVAGTGPARGYDGRPDLTAERFLADPYGSPGSRMYRTGDYMRTLDNGVLDFVGRADRMVKVRGNRVEPEEVEANLARNPLIRQVTVLAPHDEQGQRYLLAFVEPVAGSRLSESDLRATAEGSLPEWMVPARFVLRDTLPVTATGKVDRKALLASLG
ncbi:amino acid adenylation domain-containing protein [Saccharopolyspora spinosa]|uniref:Amino acid adenylation domain-containing protein n=1 Tax=Saccharopolyspora spinosa TaxID=60894 RepID=A0A2N3Y5J8_SACSN|nr:amino acid adenylation domain-containing protein [Saccharopolyspora spinosa]PKW18121.1 amino acid adenylation domain-containing protein [Saccharopolyspora spinosa]